tara:strand:- start:2376 stop:2708 length:333 start_codon:yes stop_codon:yes gene_type:complete
MQNKGNRTQKNSYKQNKIGKRKTQRNYPSHRGGGLGNYLWKGFNIFKKDPLQFNTKGRESDALFLVNLFSDDEWRQVKRNILALAKVDLDPSIMESDLGIKAKKVLRKID